MYGEVVKHFVALLLSEGRQAIVIGVIHEIIDHVTAVIVPARVQALPGTLWVIGVDAGGATVVRLTCRRRVTHKITRQAAAIVEGVLQSEKMAHLVNVGVAFAAASANLTLGAVGAACPTGLVVVHHALEY
jgi:hypothetical protein